MAITFLDVQLLFCKNTQKNKISARISEIFIILQIHSSAESPKGSAGGCDFYGIERLLTLICAIVNFATLQAVSRCGNE